MPELLPAAIARALDPIASLERRDQPGSPAPRRVKEAQAALEGHVSALAHRATAARARTELCDWMREFGDDPGALRGV